MKNFWILILILFSACTHSQGDGESPLVSIQIHDRNGLTETISTPERLEVFQQLDFLSAQPFKKVLRVFKEQGKHAAKITTYHPNGTPWQYLETQEMRAFGAYKEWHPNGQLKIEASVIGGAADITPGAQQDWLFDGSAKVFDDQGRPVALIPYEKGVMEGKALYYHSNGTLERELPYHKNELDGDLLEFLPNGNLKSKTHYEMGKKEGTSKGIWSETEANWLEEYHEGLLLEGLYYLPNGSLVSEVHHGYGFQALFDQNSLSQLIEFRKGKPEGIVKHLTPSGDILSSYYVKQGKKHGEEISYFIPNELEEGVQPPLPRLSVPWIDDAISGIVKTWYNNGKLESQRELSRNKKTGTALAWYREGGLMYMEEYEEDRLIKGTYYKKNRKEPISTVANGNGTATLFDEQGIFLRKIQYLKGKAVDPEN